MWTSLIGYNRLGMLEGIMFLRGDNWNNFDEYAACMYTEYINDRSTHE